MATLEELILADPQDGPSRLEGMQEAPSGEAIARTVLSAQERLLAVPTGRMNDILHPVKVISKSTPQDQISSRIDTKLAEIAEKTENASPEDVNYLIDNFLLYRALENGGGDLNDEIVSVTKEILDLLLSKNIAYGDSALKPVGIFANADDPVSQIYVRLDDKLSRILRGSSSDHEDVVLDIIGYLVLLAIAMTDQPA